MVIKMTLEDSVLKLDELLNEIVYFRLLLDIDLAKEKVDSNKKNESVGKYNIFGKMSNKIKENTQNKYNEKIDELNKNVEDFLSKNPKIKKDLTEAMLKEDIDKYLKNDKYGFSKDLLSLLVTYDCQYEYQFIDEEKKKISLIIYNDEAKLEASCKQIKNVVKTISNKSYDKKDSVLPEAFRLMIANFIAEGNFKDVSASIESKNLANLVVYGLNGMVPNKDEIIKLYHDSDLGYVAVSLGLKTYLLTRAKYELNNLDFKTLLSSTLDVLTDVEAKAVKELFIEEDNIENDKMLIEEIDKVFSYLIKEFKL